VSAFGCCLACLVGGARLLFAMARDVAGDRGLARVSAQGTPARSAGVVVAAMGAIILVCATAFGAHATDTFAWMGTIGTLILLVAYGLTTIGAIRLLFVHKRLPTPMWQIVIPLAALVMLGYTLYRNVIPYPESGPARWFPVVAGVWLVVAVIAVLAVPELARRLGRNLAEAEGIPAA
jgi:amino acid transporter